MIAVGLMSGTSLDGIDAALVRIEPRGASYSLDLLAFATMPFEADLLERLRAVLPPAPASAAQLAEVHRSLGLAFARAARHVSGALRVDYVASHGQTVFHDGEAHVTLQLGDPFAIREVMNASVCYDFRSADCAVGGHGAPLVPYVDALLLASDEEDRVAVNIGGIANITALPRLSEHHDVLAFDSGPGVMLIDAFVRARTRGEVTIDLDGAFAAAGAPNRPALATMLEDAYFRKAAPKSTGRERFGDTFLQSHRDLLDRLSIEDGCATLAELTAATIADAVRGVGLEGARVLCSGGGVHNLALMRALALRLPQARVAPTDVLGIPADAKEAMAFAVLGYETLRERASNVPRVTGASRAVPLGAIAPSALQATLARLESECRST